MNDTKIETIFDPGKSDEDSLLVTKDTFGVFDGFSGYEHPRTGDGKFAVTTAARLFKQKKPLLAIARELCGKINARMRSQKRNPRDKMQSFGTAAAVVRLKQTSFEWLQIGDCIIIVIFKDKSWRVLVRDYHHDRADLVIWKKYAKRKVKDIRSLFDKYWRKTRSRINGDWGCFTAEPESLEFVNRGTELLEGVQHILLFTDGLFLPQKDPAKEDDWKMFVELYHKGGLRAIKRCVRALEKKDAYCWKYPRFKRYDDIAGIAITL